MSRITSENSLRYGALQKLRSDNFFRYSNNRVSSLNLLRYKAGKRVTSLNRARYQSFTLEFENTWKYGGASDPDSLPQVSVLVDGSELCPAPEMVQVTHSESGPARWTIGIKDTLGYYHPENESSPWAGKIVRNKSVIITVTWEGAEYKVVGKITSYGHSRNFTQADSFDFTFSGIDTSSALFRTGVTLPSLRSSRAGLQTTKTAAADVLGAVGLPCNLDMMEATNIRLQHRQDGRPGDWFQKNLDVLHHEWIMIGGVVYVYLPNWFGPAQWNYGVGAAILLEDNRQNDAPTMVNSVASRRAKETGAGGLAPIEHTNFGQYTQTFNPPLEGVYWKKILQQGGIYSDFRLYSGGALYAVREARGTYTGGETGTNIGMVDKIVYTFGNASPEQIATSGFGKIQFLGAEKDRDDQNWPEDQVYSVSRRNQSSLDAGDDLNHQELAASTLIDGQKTLERNADGLLRKNAAEPTKQDFRVFLNLLMFPGQSANIRDAILGTKKRYIREVTHNIGMSLADSYTQMSTVWFDPNLNIVDAPLPEAS